jgi:hypothetical protein
MEEVWAGCLHLFFLGANVKASLALDYSYM